MHLEKIFAQMILIIDMICKKKYSVIDFVYAPKRALQQNNISSTRECPTLCLCEGRSKRTPVWHRTRWTSHGPVNRNRICQRVVGNWAVAAWWRPSNCTRVLHICNSVSWIFFHLKVFLFGRGEKTISLNLELDHSWNPILHLTKLTT